MTKQVARPAIRQSINEFDDEALILDEIPFEDNIFAGESPDVVDRIAVAIAALCEVRSYDLDTYDNLDPIERLSVYKDALQGRVFSYATLQSEEFTSSEYRQILDHMNATYEERLFYREFCMLETIADDNDRF